MKRLMLTALAAALIAPAGTAAGSPPGPIDACLATAPGAIATCLRGGSPIERVLRGTMPSANPALELDCVLAGIDDRCEAWKGVIDDPAQYGEGGFGFDHATGIAVHGGSLFVIGSSMRAGSLDIVAAAFEAATGKPLWRTGFDGPGAGFDAPGTILVDGGRGMLFLTGVVDVDPATLQGGLMPLIALDAASGAVLWSRTLAGTAPGGDVGWGLALSPAGDRLFGIATTHGAALDHDLVVSAFDPDDGDQLWSRTVGGARDEHAVGIAATADRVVVGGSVYKGTGIDFDYLTFGLDHDGEPVWSRTDDGGIREYDELTAMTISADRARVYVTGATQTGPQPLAGSIPIGFRTLALDPANGVMIWQARFAPVPPAGPPGSVPLSIAASPTGSGVFATGLSADTVASYGHGYATVGYAEPTGENLWAASYHPTGAGYNLPTDVAVSGDGATVVVAGDSFLGSGVQKGDVATVAYTAASGEQRWAARWTRPGDDVADLWPYAAHVTADGTRAYTVGTYVNYYPDGEPSQFDGNFSDMRLAAYTL